MKTALEVFIEDVEEIMMVKGQLWWHERKQKALKKEKEQMIDLVQSLKDYTHESHIILGHDEREASEFVEIYYKD
jgi:hypothetical protein